MIHRLSVAARVLSLAPVFALVAALAACQQDGPEIPTDARSLESAGTKGGGTRQEPGTRPANFTGPSSSSLQSIDPVVTETGNISLSQDGLGTISSTGTVTIVKPAGATVRDCYMAAASRGFSGFSIPNGTVTIDAAGVSWSTTIAGAISNFNHFANVTALTKPTLDAAAAGPVSFLIGEGGATSNIDGTILACIFNDPAQLTTNTVILLFGAQEIAGDSFVVTWGTPLNVTGLILDMALGISFGHQPSGQFSNVTVNSSPLTTCAGGEDDGEVANGALLTVGGTGDSNANPAPACSSFAGPLVDDELYDLVPFTSGGDTQTTVFTNNPSADDNIFFASFFANRVGSIGPPPSDGGPGTCGGFPTSPGVTSFTFSGVTTFIGTEHEDVIGGTNGVDIILGKGEEDLLCGWGGRDNLDGGGGDDEMYGGDQDDFLFGKQGADYLDGEGGQDRLDGGHTPVPSSSPDTHPDTCVSGGSKPDRLYLCEIVIASGGGGSSALLKDHVIELLPEGMTLFGVRPVAFRYVEPYGDPSLPQVGFIAEEVAQVYPEAIIYQDDRVWGISYTALNAMLVEEVGKRATHAIHGGAARLVEAAF